jgi:hypothetical protein
MIPAALVRSQQQALDHPQVQATGTMQPVIFPGLRVPAPVAVCLWLSEPKAAPARAHHRRATDAAPGKLVYSFGAIARLWPQNVVRGRVAGAPDPARPGAFRR